MDSSHLWYTGISENGKSYISHKKSININEIQKHIDFTSEEISLIYSKLKVSLKQIEQKLRREKKESLEFIFIGGWSDLLLKMQIFILKNKLFLQEDYRQTASLIQELYEKELDIISIADALSSNDASKIEKGLSCLFYRINYFEEKVSDYKKEYILIVFNLILRNDVRLELCLQHMEWSLKNHLSDFDKGLFQPLIGEVLNVYQAYYSEENQTGWFLSAEKESVEKSLMIIYEIYKSWGMRIEFWENYKPKFYSD